MLSTQFGPIDRADPIYKHRSLDDFWILIGSAHRITHKIKSDRYFSINPIIIQHINRRVTLLSMTSSICYMVAIPLTYLTQKKWSSSLSGNGNPASISLTQPKLNRGANGGLEPPSVCLFAYDDDRFSWSLRGGFHQSRRVFSWLHIPYVEIPPKASCIQSMPYKLPVLLPRKSAFLSWPKRRKNFTFFFWEQFSAAGFCHISVESGPFAFGIGRFTKCSLLLKYLTSLDNDCRTFFICTRHPLHLLTRAFCLKFLPCVHLAEKKILG